MNCIVCLNHLSGSKTHYCSRRCKRKWFRPKSIKLSKQRAKTRKIDLVILKGGCCQCCGYNENLSALTFHHRYDKSFHLTQTYLRRYKLERILLELDKCDLLCMNCHMELHHPDMDRSILLVVA
jgi:hypothetical protein